MNKAAKTRKLRWDEEFFKTTVSHWEKYVSLFFKIRGKNSSYNTFWHKDEPQTNILEKMFMLHPKNEQPLTFLQLLNDISFLQDKYNYVCFQVNNTYIKHIKCQELV